MWGSSPITIAKNTEFTGLLKCHTSKITYDLIFYGYKLEVILGCGRDRIEHMCYDTRNNVSIIVGYNSHCIDNNYYGYTSTPCSGVKNYIKTMGEFMNTLDDYFKCHDALERVIEEFASWGLDLTIEWTNNGEYICYNLVNNKKIVIGYNKLCLDCYDYAYVMICNSQCINKHYVRDANVLKDIVVGYLRSNGK